MGDEVPKGIPQEHVEDKPESPLSVNGSQLRALALADMIVGRMRTFREERDSKAEEPSFIKRHARKLVPARFKTSEEPVDVVGENLRQAILAGDKEQAANAVEAINFPNMGEYRNKPKDILASLDGDLPVESVIRQGSDAEFLRSLVGHASTDMPKDWINIPTLGIKAFVSPPHNVLRLTVYLEENNPTRYFFVNLPLDQQHFEWLHDLEIYGQDGADVLRSQLDVFGGLAKTMKTVYTHVTDYAGIAGMLDSGSMGTADHRTESGKGFNVEEASLGNADAYERAVAQIDAGETPDLPVNKIVKQGSDMVEKPSFVTATYPNKGSAGPIAVFDDALSGHHNIINLQDRRDLKNRLVDGVIKLDDPSFVGFFVTPTLKGHFLHWIDTWDETRKHESFGDRDPASLFITSAEDLPKSIT